MKKRLFGNLLIITCLSGIITFSETENKNLYTDTLLKKAEMQMKNAGINRKSIDTFTKALKTENKEQIEELLLKSIKQDRKNYFAYRALGDYYSNKKYGNNQEKALEYYKKSFRINSDSPQAYSKLGKAYSELGNYEKAKYYYKEIIKKFPRSEEGYLGMSEVLIYEGKNEEAERYTEKIIETYRKNENIEEIKKLFEFEQSYYTVAPKKGLEKTEKNVEKNTENIKKTEEMYPEEISFPASPAVISEQSVSLSASDAKAAKRDNSEFDSNDKKEADFNKERNEAKAQMLLSLAYFENKEYKKGFASFYENYSKYADLLDEETINEIISKVKKYNSQIKHTNRILYNRNLKKFRDLEI